LTENYRKTTLPDMTPLEQCISGLHALSPSIRTLLKDEAALFDKIDALLIPLLKGTSVTPDMIVNALRNTDATLEELEFIYLRIPGYASRGP
jgi:hypothetical protein